MKLAAFLRVSTMSVALMTGFAVATVIATPDSAYAGKGNGNGGGSSDKGGSSGKGGSADKGAKSNNGKGSDKASSRSAGGTSNGKATRGRNPLKAIGNILRTGKVRETTRREKAKSAPSTKRVAKTAIVQAPTTSAAPAPKPKRNRLAAELGVHPSELGALNAANASPTALKNASPESRVGKIALYAVEVQRSRELAAELHAAKAELEALEQPTRSPEEIDTELSAAEDAKKALEGDLAQLEADLAAAGGQDAAIEAELVEVNNSINGINSDIAALEQERLDGQEYSEKVDQVAEIEEQLATQEETQRDRLEAASNKEVTDEVEVAVQKLLGIYVDPAEDPLTEDDVDSSETLPEDEIVSSE